MSENERFDPYVSKRNHEIRLLQEKFGHHAVPRHISVTSSQEKPEQSVKDEAGHCIGHGVRVVPDPK